MRRISIVNRELPESGKQVVFSVGGEDHIVVEPGREAVVEIDGSAFIWIGKGIPEPAAFTFDVETAGDVVVSNVRLDKDELGAVLSGEYLIPASASEADAEAFFDSMSMKAPAPAAALDPEAIAAELAASKGRIDRLNAIIERNQGENTSDADAPDDDDDGDFDLDSELELAAAAETARQAEPLTHTADELHGLSFMELRNLAKTMEIKGRGKDELVREILAKQAA